MDANTFVKIIPAFAYKSKSLLLMRSIRITVEIQVDICKSQTSNKTQGATQWYDRAMLGDEEYESKENISLHTSHSDYSK